MHDGITSVVTAVEAAVDGLDSPLVPVALQVAARLDDPDTPSKDVAGLSRELRQVLVMLDDVTGADVDPIDELAAKRNAKSAG